MDCKITKITKSARKTAPVMLLTALMPFMANAQDFDASDISNIVNTSRDNALRFERDFKGKVFSGSFALRSVDKEFLSDTYVVSFGDGWISEVSCTGLSKIDALPLIDVKDGTSLWIRGEIKTTIMGSVNLINCNIL